MIRKNFYKAWNPELSQTGNNEAMWEPSTWAEERWVTCINDLFGDDIQQETIAESYDVVCACPQHKFHVWTHYPERMARALQQLTNGTSLPPNLWLGILVRDQKQLDERLPVLLTIPAATHWVESHNRVYIHYRANGEPVVVPVLLRLR